MPSERIQRQVDLLLDEAESAIGERDWQTVLERAHAALTLDPESADAQALREAGERGVGTAPSASPAPPLPSAIPPASQPTSFASRRYEVRRFLGEGGKKHVFLAHDWLLDRDVAFALVRTEGLNATGRERVRREAQAMEQSARSSRVLLRG